MTVNEMHYMFKTDLNKLDSRNRNLHIPEIDYFLNRGYDLFVKSAFRNDGLLPTKEFELNQANIEDLKMLIVSNKELVATNKSSILPLDYMFHIESYALTNNKKCNKRLRCYQVQHDDLHRESTTSNSSFFWEECNITFEQNKVVFYETDFTVDKYLLSYIKKPKLIHNAAQYNNGTYQWFDGTILTGTSNCELTFTAHSKIVAIAVYLAASSLELPTVNQRLTETNL
jgi:hypothetical protein